MKAFPKFMASGAGRILRIVAGIALLLVGWFLLEDIARYVVMVIALVPLLAGLFDYCVFAPLFGMSIKGPEIRGEKQSA
jgi:hypothetical protein